MSSFDLQKTPLDKGTTLLEASAGTGKTFTIEGLYLRLLLEEKLEVKDIVVVTYTVAATAELRDRIRTRINSALEQYNSGSLTDPALTTPWTPEAAVASKLLLKASISFDEAQVFTIHSFCQRILKETAFETLITFDRQLEADPSRLQKTLLNDFRRVHFGDELPLCSQYAFASSYFKKKLTKLDQQLGANTEYQIIPPFSLNLAEIEAGLCGLSEQIIECWKSNRDEILEFLSNKPFSRGKDRGYTDSHISEISAAVESYSSSGMLTGAAVKALKKLCRSVLLDKALARWKTAAAEINHPLFDLCELFCKQEDRLIIEVCHAFREFRETRLRAFKAQQNVFTFDDLLSELGRILASDAATNLIHHIRTRYRAALIDEFQDTDSLQWKIFHSFFGGPDQTLFIVGDPKQAIYRFRGADVYAYLAAASSSSRRYSLQTNWRSDPALITGVSAVFAATPNPFRVRGIDFQEPSAGNIQPSEKRFVAAPSLPQEPLRFIVHPSPKKLYKGECRDWALPQMVDDIVELLESTTTVGGRSIQPSDIAVLARANKDIREIQDVLLRAGVPAVLETDASVFDSDEAKSLLQLMCAMIESRRPGYLKACLAGIFFGYDSASLYALETRDTEMQEKIEHFIRYGQVWAERGFMVAYRTLEREENIRARLLSLPRGERILTNILHLVEIVHSEECATGMSPASLFNWLNERCEDPESRGSSEHQLRLESDSNAVRIMSIHKSKGLEFPVVFLPGNSSPSTTPSDKIELAAFNGEEGRPYIWIKSSLEDDASRQKHQSAVLSEEFADSIRLLYVALTRARNRCHVYLARGCSDDEMTALPIASVLGAYDWDSLEQHLRDLSSKHPTAIAFETREEASGRKFIFKQSEDAHTLVARSWPSEIQRGAMLTSFSAIRGHDVELPERDEGVAIAQVEDAPAQGIHAFPKGASTGNFFHSVFEAIDFDAPDTWEPSIQKQLSAYAFTAELGTVAQSAISNVLNADLPELGIPLCRIPRKQVAKEVEFYFPVNQLDLPAITAAFEAAGPVWASHARHLKNASRSNVQGYIKGYIDLLFQHDGRYHILDWKTNWLGPSLPYYNSKAILRAIGSERYFLQYALYTVAIHRYLKRRIKDYSYDRCVGNVYYVFLRGVDLMYPGSGFHCVRLPESLVEALDATLSEPALV